VIGQNKLTCDWPEWPVARGTENGHSVDILGCLRKVLKRAIGISVGCSHTRISHNKIDDETRPMRRQSVEFMLMLGAIN
jgi:hypothetical protein